jgi:hypothetical protein
VTAPACIDHKSLPDSAQLHGYSYGFVINAGSGSGIPRLAPENSAALWRKEFRERFVSINVF